MSEPIDTFHALAVIFLATALFCLGLYMLIGPRRDE